MDPNACVEIILDYLSVLTSDLPVEDREEAQEGVADSLSDLEEWIGRGGFAPSNLDELGKVDLTDFPDLEERIQGLLN